MKKAISQQSGFSAACLLYDPADGRVVHGHRVEVMPGAKKQSLSEQEIEHDARYGAKHAGHPNVEKLMVLHVKDEEVDGVSQCTSSEHLRQSAGVKKRERAIGLGFRRRLADAGAAVTQWSDV
jgi:hypothetical protein